MELSERIRQLRKEHKLKLREIAEATGLSTPYVSDIERGRTAPAIKTLTAIAGVFNMTLVELLQGVDFSGEADLGELPSTLQDFIHHPEFEEQIDEDWLAILKGIRLRGKTPASVQEWMMVYLVLREVLE
jgi:transcriptional regulator with XRE-family HTH domain